MNWTTIRKITYPLAILSLLLGIGLVFKDWLTFTRPITQIGGFDAASLLSGTPPEGPVRLTREEQAVVDARIAAVSGGSPAFRQLPEDERILYHLKKGAQCNWQFTHLQLDLADANGCNAIGRTDLGFEAMLKAMHPKAQHYLYREYEPGLRAISIYFFPGRDGRGHVLFSLTRASEERLPKPDETVSIQISHGDPRGYHNYDAVDLSLDSKGKPQRQIYAGADPVPVTTDADIGLVATSPSGGRRYLAKVNIDPELMRRHAFYAAILGTTVPAVVAPPERTLEQVKNEISPLAGNSFMNETTSLLKPLQEILGADRARGLVFGKNKIHIDWMIAYGIRANGQLYVFMDQASKWHQTFFTLKSTGKPIDGILTNENRTRLLIPVPNTVKTKGADTLLAFRKDRPKIIYSGIRDLSPLFDGL